MPRNIKTLTFLLICFLIIAVSIAYWKVQQDDAYIFYTYARNIIDGNGYVFNQGEKLNATTSPLYTLILALFSFISQAVGLSIPLIAHIVGGVSLLFSSFLLLKIFRKETEPLLALFLPLLFLINPLLRNAVGMETFLYMALILASLWNYKTEKYTITSIFLALASLTRFDGFLFVIIIMLDFIIRKKKFLPVKPVITFLIILLPWFIFSKIYFGTFFPSTITAKLSQSYLGTWGTGLIFLKGITSAFAGNKMISGTAIILLLLSFILVVLKRRDLLNEFPMRIILFWSLLYLFIYGFILNPPPYPWYYTPFTIVISLIFACAINIISTDYISLSGYKTIIVLMIISVLGLILPLKTFYNGPTPKFKKYKGVAEWLNKNVQPGTSVAVDEIGIMGYYYREGKIIDILGLINPEVIPHLIKGEYTWYIDKYKPDFIVTDYPTPSKYSSIIFTDEFNKAYSVSVIIGTGKSMSVLFSRKQ